VILVIAEQREGTLNRATWEALAAAQQLAAGDAIRIAVLGASGLPVAQQLAAAGVGDVVSTGDAALEPYTPDGYVMAVAQIIASTAPQIVAMAHTYQARDFAPMLAARLNLPLITDVTGINGTGRDATFTRPMFQGKLAAEVKPAGAGACLVTFQIGAFRAGALKRGTSPSLVTSHEVTIDRAAIRQKPEAPFQEAKQAVDLTQAARIVAVGRGIKSQEHLPVAQTLAKAMGAELAASRPICDSGWLPMERQIGSSGQTVAPKLYVALGISGAIPIFEVADYGIVGDLFEIVPALVAELEK
jgi:electron transfer flavoprotein alpha subunit